MEESVGDGETDGEAANNTPTHTPHPFLLFPSYLDRRRDRTGPSFTYEVVIVDDGSADGTARVAFSAARARGADAVRVLRLPRNRGKGAAVRAGAFVTRGERLLMMDADGATRVADLDRLDAALTEATTKKPSPQSPGTAATSTLPLGAALGSRAHLAAGVSATRSAHRNFLMKGFHALVVAVAGPAVADTQCGFKLFTRRAARLLFGNQRLQRWCFDGESGGGGVCAFVFVRGTCFNPPSQPPFQSSSSTWRPSCPSPWSRWRSTGLKSPGRKSESRPFCTWRWSWPRSPPGTGRACGGRRGRASWRGCGPQREEKRGELLRVRTSFRFENTHKKQHQSNTLTPRSYRIAEPAASPAGPAGGRRRRRRWWSRRLVRRPPRLKTRRRTLPRGHEPRQRRPCGQS